MHFLTTTASQNLPTGQDDRFNQELLSLWLHRYKSQHTKRAYGKDVEDFLTFVGNKPLHQVTYLEMQGFEEKLALSGLAPRSINRKIHAVRSLLTFGCERVRMLPTNVGAVMESYKVKDDLAQRILTEEEVFRIFTLETGARNGLLLRFLYYTGLRVSEIVAIKWKDLAARSNGEGQVTVFGKGGKTRVVLIPEQVWRSLSALERGKSTDPLFPSQKGGGHLNPSQAFRIVRAAGDRAGIEGVSPHWLRHSHASHSMDRGCPLHVVQATLGHSNPATTGRYLHARPSDGSGRYLG